MTAAETRDLVLELQLYVMLPLWGFTGFVDWCCHRATKIEDNSGLRECMLHLVMGVQVGIPIILSLTFEMNVAVMLLCVIALLAHEIVAHYDVHYASPRRHISIWETHAHNYLATIPFYMVALVAVRNWETFIRLVTFEWGGHMQLILRSEPVGGPDYLSQYLLVMAVLCYLPYCEELVRCLLARRKSPA